MFLLQLVKKDLKRLSFLVLIVRQLKVLGIVMPKFL